MNITFQKASIQNLQEIINLNKDCFADNPKYDLDFKVNFESSEEGRSYFIESINNPLGIFMLVYFEGDLVGYFNVSASISFYRNSKWAELENIGIKAEYRNRGIGRRILNFTEEWAQLNKCKYLYISVYDKNLAMKSLLKSENYDLIDLGFYKRLSK